MKKPIILFLSLPILFSACATSQIITFTESEYLVKVYDVSADKDQLYTKAHAWMIDVFNNAESVIQHGDKQEGVIIGKYLMQDGLFLGLSVFAIIDIRVKDNKARIEIKPQDKWTSVEGGIYASIYKYSKEMAINEMNALADSFHLAMEKEGVKF